MTTQILGLPKPVLLKVKGMGIDSYPSAGKGKEKKNILVVLEVIVGAMRCVCACAGTSVIAGYSSLLVVCVCVRVFLTQWLIKFLQLLHTEVSYGMYGKVMVFMFAVKASLERKGLQEL